MHYISKIAVLNADKGKISLEKYVPNCYTPNYLTRGVKIFSWSTIYFAITKIKYFVSNIRAILYHETKST